MSTEHDFTNGRWGHNLSVLNWDTDAHSGRAVCWVTPGLRNGDIVIVKSQAGSMRLVASDVKRAPNVDDMYIFAIDPEQTETPQEEAKSWVVKVKRYDGGHSVIDVTTKEKAKELVDEFNAQYQTDNYFIEEYDEKKHAYSRHG